EVIDPPYTSVTRTIGSGFSGAINVKLNKKNTLAFVADYGNNTVTIVNYVTGANVTVLGRANGVVSPRAVVDWPNAVY
ncbi:MAG: hypothetical protein JO324_02270, partial [Candidatus Eremiobacteraeota bacterium]|nr:hypothetical protein [Candidatus Eremiobacteraeota bacterium]